jgi:hypothetical protein
MTSQIKPYHGAPTLFIDDQPVFYGLMWGSPPTAEDYLLKESARLYGEAGVHFFAFDIGTGGAAAEWCGPGPDRPSSYDFSTLAQRFGQIIAADPLARFHLRVHLEMPEWWQKLYPDECEVLSDGRRMCQSFASEIWRAQAKAFLAALVSAVQDAGLAERVVGYQCGAGWTGEWVKGPGAMGLVTGDFSRPMQAHFQSWLSLRYNGDLRALRTAWADPLVTFETAQVPGIHAQHNTTAFTFRDPLKEQAVIDYYRCLAELCGDLVVDFCSAVKQASGGQALAGAFYGYLLDQAWNAGFFGEGADSDFSTIQRGGHLGLARVLQSDAVDFLVSPYSYGFRGIGGDGPAMPPSESMRQHGKLYILEDDTRTHLTAHDHPNFGKTDTLQESTAVLQRNLAYVLTHAQGIWWLAGGSPRTPHIELSQQPAFQALIKQFQELGTWALNLDREPSAEIAVLVDDESFYYEGVKNSLDVPLIFQQRLWGLARLGAAHDVFMLDDLLAGGLKPYKLYVFLNAFRLDAARRAALKQVLRRDGRTALWIYAPGYLQDSASLANMTDLTGISFGSGDHPWGPQIQLTDLSHPITRGLPQDLTWGTNSLLGPVFHTADDGARVLGSVVYSQGRCRPGFVVKEFGGWKSVYSAAPNLPAPILRGVARYAGVHLYSDAGDVLYATPNLLAVHTAAGGARTYQLPRSVEVVADLFQGQVVAENSDCFQVHLPPASTALYFTGPRSQLPSSW